MTYHVSFPRSVLTASRTAVSAGIDNNPPRSLESNLVRLSHALGFIETELQKQYGPNCKLKINSGYRSPALNKAVGGSDTSMHRFGLAADITCNMLKPHELATFIRKVFEGYDQIIAEFGSWVHLGLALDGQKPRRQALTAVKRKNEAGVMKTAYLQGIVAA